MTDAPAAETPADIAKRAAARRSCDLVEDGMTVGLGTGSTADWMTRGLGERVRDEGLSLRGVATSARTAALAESLGIPVVALNDASRIDLTIDGADEVDPALRLIKGGGGAHLREKLVAAASERMVVVADAGKWVETLGAFPLPVEVIPMGWRSIAARVGDVLAAEGLGGREVALRGGTEAPFVTDEGNHILDLHLGRIDAPERLAAALDGIAGVVETGLFVGLCDLVLLGHGDGRVEDRTTSQGATA